MAEPSRTTAMPVRAPLIEVFYSIQGEGRHVGQPMGFVRTATCPIRCRYCDTTESYTASSAYRIACGDAVVMQPNPVSAADAYAAIERAQQASVYAAAKPVISVTGGEPLVFPQFLVELGEQASVHGAALHLETAALDPEALTEVLPVLAHLSADYKLRGTLLEGQDSTRAAHVACLEAAGRTKVTIDVKLVLTPGLAEEAIEEALRDLAPFRSRILLIVQPVTPELDVAEPSPPAEIGRLVRSALDQGFDLRVIPQVHKTLGVI